MTEQWKPVVGYESAYEVSDLGRVRRRAKIDSRGRPSGGSVLKTTVNVKGYHRVQLSLDGEAQKFSVHALVLEAFVGTRRPGEECRHLDNDPGNNRLTNLVWGSREENTSDRLRAGHYARGQGHQMAQIDDATARQIKADLASNPRSIDVANKYGVSKYIVDNIRVGKTWRHL